MLPPEKFFLICKKIAGNEVWAVSLSQDTKGRFIWDVFCSDETKCKLLNKKLPSKLKNGELFVVYHSSKPNSTNPSP